MEARNHTSDRWFEQLGGENEEETIVSFYGSGIKHKSL